MGQNSSLHRLAVHHAHILPGQEIQAVEVVCAFFNVQIALRLFDIHHRLEHDARAVLHELAHGMQIGGKNNAGGEQALLVLALALAEKLFVPLVHHREVRLIASHQFHALSLAVQDIARRSIAVALILRAAHSQFLPCFGGARHQRVDVAARGGDGQQAYSRQHRIAAAHIVRHNECFVALVCGKFFQRAARLVRCGVNTAFRSVLTVLFLQQGLEDAERQRRLGRGAGFGNDVHGNVLAFAGIQHALQVGGADGIAHIKNLRRSLAGVVVKRSLQRFNGGAGAQIAAADSDDDENVAVGLNLCRSLFDAGEFFFIIIHRQIHPAQKIAAGAGLAVQRFVCQADLRENRVEFIVRDEFCKVSAIHFDTH